MIQFQKIERTRLPNLLSLFAKRFRSFFWAKAALTILLLLGSAEFHKAPAKEILSTAQMQNLIQHADKDITEFLNPVGNDRFRSSESVLVLNIRNYSQKWSLGRNEQQRKENQHKLSEQFARRLATSESPVTKRDRFSAAAFQPDEALHTKLNRMVLQPEDWVEKEKLMAEGIKWILYGYIVDVPGAEEPYAVFKLTNAWDRRLIWGGCFSAGADKKGHRDNALYSPYITDQLMTTMNVPAWAKPEGGGSMPTSYWLAGEKSSSTRISEKSIFADMVVVEFLRASTFMPKCSWIDPEILNNYAAQQREDKEGIPRNEASGEIPAYDVLKELYHNRDWQGPTAFITGHVQLERPGVETALLKGVKFASREKTEKSVLTPHVFTGYCSASNNYRSRFKWVESNFRVIPDNLSSGEKTLSVARTEAFDDAQRFQDIVEIALARSNYTNLRIIEHTAQQSEAADFKATCLTDERRPPSALYTFIKDRASQDFVWSRKQPNPERSGPEKKYEKYATQVANAIRTGATNYGNDPAFVWHLREAEASREQAKNAGKWDPDTMGMELLDRLVDTSNPFIRSVNNAKFGRGDFEELQEQASRLRQDEGEDGLQAIVFQLIPRGEDQRQCLVVKYLNPANGQVDWMYYDEPRGRALTARTENRLFTKVRTAFSELSAGDVGSEGTCTFDNFYDHGIVNLGIRPREMMLTQLTYRSGPPLVQKKYITKGIVEQEEDGERSVFDKGVRNVAEEEFGVASVVQSELVPALYDEENQADVNRQLFAWETSLDNYLVEDYSAFPEPHLKRVSTKTDKPGIQFLYSVVKRLMSGAENTLNWDGSVEKPYERLREQNPLFGKVLKRALQDYQRYRDLNQNIVIAAPSKNQTNMIVTSGTTRDSLSQGEDFTGVRAAENLIEGPRVTGITKADIKTTERKIANSGQVGDTVETAVSDVFPPDWYNHLPGETSVFGIPFEQAAGILRRQVAFYMHKEGISLLDTLALKRAGDEANDAESSGDSTVDKPAISDDVLRNQAEDIGREAARVSIELTDPRAFIITDEEGSKHIVHSITIEPSARQVHPTNNIMGVFSTFRYFYIQELSPDHRLSSLPAEMLSAAHSKDISNLKNYQENGRDSEARKLRNQVMEDLKTWKSAFPEAKQTTNDLASKTVSAVMAHQMENIGSAIQKTFDQSNETHRFSASAKDRTRKLLNDIENWQKAFPDVVQEARATRSEIADMLKQKIVSEYTSSMTGLVDTRKAEDLDDGGEELKPFHVTNGFEEPTKQALQYQKSLIAFADIVAADEDIVEATKVQEATETYVTQVKQVGNAFFERVEDWGNDEKRHENYERLLNGVEHSLDGLELKTAGEALGPWSELSDAEQKQRKDWDFGTWKDGFLNSFTAAETLQEMKTGLEEAIEEE